MVHGVLEDFTGALGDIAAPAVPVGHGPDEPASHPPVVVPVKYPPPHSPASDIVDLVLYKDHDTTHAIVNIQARVATG